MVVSIGIRRIYDLDPSTVVAGSSILLPYFPFSIFTPPGLWFYLCLDLHTAVISVCIAFIWASEIREAHKMLLEIITMDHSDLFANDSLNLILSTGSLSIAVLIQAIQNPLRRWKVKWNMRWYKEMFLGQQIGLYFVLNIFCSSRIVFVFVIVLYNFCIVEFLC